MKVESGTITKWNDQKGFGFISPASGGKPVFFHINDYSHIHKRPQPSLKVQYFVSTDKNGRPCAIDVAPIKSHKNNARERRQQLFSLTLLSSFSLVLYLLLTSRLIPVEVVYLYGVMSVAAFLMYAKDKNAAEWGRWRTAESTLHTLSLLGGWPGAKIAQSFLRHKSKKTSFRFTYWVTVALNCGALYWLITPEGSKWLSTLLQTLNIG